MIKRSRNKPFQLDLESLETRTMLAGDVTVAVLDGNVVVQGDSAANRIVVATDSDTGALVVDGRIHAGEATTINGQQAPFIFDDFNNSLLIQMRAGADVVDVPRGEFANNLFIGMGQGADRLFFGPGSDDGSIGESAVNIGGHLTVGLGRGSDALAANGLSSGSMAVFAGRGADAIGLSNTAIDNQLLMRTGPGNDRVRLSNVQSPHADVHTGMGHDRLAVLDSAFARFDARMGLGNDRVVLEGNNVFELATLGGGQGHDVIINLGDNNAEHYVIAGFEVIWNGADDGAASADDGSATADEVGADAADEFAHESRMLS